MDIMNLSAAELLALKTPERLYTGDVEEAKHEYRRLAAKWHPDHGGDDAVFAHVKGLYEEAEKKIASGHWETPGVVRIDAADGRRFEIRYKKSHDFELGKMYLADTVVVYLIDKQHADLVKNAARITSSFKYADDKMKKEFQRYLPETLAELETSDGRFMVAYKKTADVLLLRDVLEHYNNEIPSEHVAWILSSLYNLACYFKYTGISHNAISPDSYFISPEFHSGVMLGGWWYSAKVGEKVIAVPQRTIVFAPADLLKTKLGDPTIDSYLIKATGLELLGDIYGTRLLLKEKADPKKYPKAFMSWLKTPGTADLVDEYSKYKKNVLVKSWGPPKFHKMELTSRELYP